MFRRALGIAEGIVLAKGETWKTARHVLTPCFSGLKIKLVCCVCVVCVSSVSAMLAML